MTPYGGLTFFCILVPLLIPAVILGLSGKSLRYYGPLVTAALLLLFFDTAAARWLLLGFWAWQLALALLASRLRRRFGGWVRSSLVALTLLPLLAYKVLGLLPGLSVSFLGISYMTFRAVDALLDLWDGRVDAFSPLDYSYFLLFAPAVSSGPLDRYRRFVSDLHTPCSGSDYAVLIRDGIWRIMTGALYYFVFGNLIWRCWLERLPAGGAGYWIGYFYGYTFFMFFNFAGYSRMAVGTAYLLGIRLPDNFNRPFLSVDLKAFWGSWHISLSSWLRDRVYTRFCMAAVRKKWFRNPHTSAYLANLLTMTLMGLWHGLTAGYLVYGLYHGAVLCGNEALDTHWKSFKKLKKRPLPRLAMQVVTFHLFAFGLLLFSGQLI